MLRIFQFKISQILNTQSFIYQSYKYIENNNWLHPLGTDFFHGGSASDRQIIEFSVIIKPESNMFLPKDSVMADR